MFTRNNPGSKVPPSVDLPELEFLDSPFDRWLRLADNIIAKHSEKARTAHDRISRDEDEKKNLPN